MKLQYGCTQNFSCANKNFLEPFYCILNHSATNQSTYDQFPPTIPFLSQDLQVTSSQQGSQEARSTLARFFSPKKGSSSKLSPTKPPFRNLSQSCIQDSTTQTLVLFSVLFLDLDLDLDGSSARFPKSSSEDLIGTKSPSTYLCLNLTSLWLVKWPKPINVWQKTIHPM